MNELHCVYRIVNFATGHVYVGRTHDAYERRIAHFAQLKRGIHHNQYLQNAYNKYGRQAFYFETLERNIPETLINEREIAWITEFDSYRDGYNLTTGGDSVGNSAKTPCTWNGIEYESVTAASRALGINDSSMTHRLQQGYTCDGDLKNQWGEVAWNGVVYKNPTNAARANGVAVATMTNRLNKGYACDADLTPLIKPKPVTYNSVEYSTVKAAAKANNVKPSIMSWRILHGITNDSDIPSPEKPVEIDGLQFPSIKKAALHFCIGTTTVGRWIRRGKARFLRE